MGGTGLRMEEKSKTDTDGPEERLLPVIYILELRV